MNGERVHAASEFTGQCLVDHAVALQPGLPFERSRYNINPVMSFSARPVPGMSFVPLRFVDDFKTFRDESFCQFSRDLIGGAHVPRIK
jgi:hypothetical protein